MEKRGEITLESIGWRRCIPFWWIIAASALAHLWCLGSQFYLDDGVQITDSEVVKNGNFTAMGLSSWTYLGYALQYRLFGMSAMGFHAVNWLLHTAVACVLFGFGRDFLKESYSRHTAFFGALLFAVHPLASEIPNYVRTQDLAWVTLFSLLAAWALMRFLRDGSWLKLLGCSVCVFGATFSKGPGLAHALMMCGAVGLATVQPAHWKILRQKWWLICGGVIALCVVIFLTGFFFHFQFIFDRWSEPRFIGHAYTVSRVFWEFAWRSLLPVHLSADHHIAETLIPAGTSYWNIPDKVAMLSAVCFLALAVVSAMLVWWKRTRFFGVCLLLYVATILFRIFYFIPEFMPEYRIYPGLPWFCLGAAIFLTAIWRKITKASPRIPAVIVLVICIVLSAKRSFLWHDLDSLMADVLKQYPAQARAIWELHKRDASRGDWSKIIERQNKEWPEVKKVFLSELHRQLPARELPTGHFAMAEVGLTGQYALALAHVKNPMIALREMNQLEMLMRQLGMDPKAKTNQNIWGYFFHHKALILEMAGKYEEAVTTLKLAGATDERLHDLRRIEKLSVQ